MYAEEIVKHDKDLKVIPILKAYQAIQRHMAKFGKGVNDPSLYRGASEEFENVSIFSNEKGDVWSLVEYKDDQVMVESFDRDSVINYDNIEGLEIKSLDSYVEDFIINY